MASKSESFYVMHLVDGDECVLFHAPTYAEAFQKARSEKIRDPRADLSIWSSIGGIVNMSVQVQCMLRVLRGLELLGTAATLTEAYALVDLYRTVMGGTRAGFWFREV